MLHAPHVGSRLVNHHAINTVVFGRHITTLQALVGHSPPPHRLCHGSLPRRRLHLSSTAPITFPRSRDRITFCLKDGTTFTQKFSPNPKARLDRLREALTELLQTPNSPPAGDEFWNWRQQEQDVSELSFGTTEWLLDPEGAAIHRHTAHAWAGELDLIEKLIMRRAEEMGHHPHIIRGKAEDGQEKFMTITCTTHSPRGLSVRDTNLARKINEILSDFETTTAMDLAGRDLDEGRQEIAALREHMVELNRDSINGALASYGSRTIKLEQDVSPKPQHPHRLKGLKKPTTFFTEPSAQRHP